MYTESILSVLAIRYEEMNAPPLTPHVDLFDDVGRKVRASV